MTNTIADKLAYLEETKGLIKQAIIKKGVSVSEGDTFRSYANKIEAIQAGGGGTVNIPDGTKFGFSTFTTVPTEIIPYLEQQTVMSSMFSYCGSLETIPLFDTKNVVDMSDMFMYCGSLQSVCQFNTKNVTNMDNMFNNCESLKTVPLFDTSNVGFMYMTFFYCMSLERIPLLNVSNVTEMSDVFSGCESLTNLGGFTGLKLNLDLSSSPLLTVDSIMNVITAAADMTSDPKTLTLHQNVFNKLTQEQIATATAKGWNIAHN